MSQQLLLISASALANYVQCVYVHVFSGARTSFPTSYLRSPNHFCSSGDALLHVADDAFQLEVSSSVLVFHYVLSLLVFEN